MREIKIDFDNPGLPQRLDVVENDAQSRFFKAVLYKDGKAYVAPDGATYSIMYRGFGPQNEGWYDTINDGAGKRAACSVSGNVVTCEIARQALRVPGHVSVVLCVTGSNGYMLHGWPIDCNCRNDNYTVGTSVESFFYITQVTNADWTSAIQTWEELKNMIDPTLSLSGKAADAAKVGEAVCQQAYLTNPKIDKNLYIKDDCTILGYDGWDMLSIPVIAGDRIIVYSPVDSKYNAMYSADATKYKNFVLKNGINYIDIPDGYRDLKISNEREIAKNVRFFVLPMQTINSNKEKLKIADNGKFLLDEIPYTYIYNADGTERSSDFYSSSDYIDLTGHKKFVIECQEDSESNALYDESYNFLQGIEYKAGFTEFVIPTNAKYLRISCHTNCLKTAGVIFDSSISYRNFTHNGAILPRVKGWESDRETIIDEAYHMLLNVYKKNPDIIPIFVCTDSHRWSPQHPQRYVNNIDTDGMKIANINLGDDVTEHWDDLKFDTIYNNIRYIKNYIGVCGNHDKWDGTSTTEYFLRRIFTSKKARYIAKSKRCCYTVKDNLHNVKYIIFDPYYAPNSGVPMVSVPTVVATWFIKELSKNDGYDIIFLNHQPLTDNNIHRDGTKQTWKMESYEEPIFSALFNVLKNRKNKRKGTYTDTDGIAHQYDFSQCENDLLCLLHGHSHEELYYIEDGLTSYVCDWDGAESTGYKSTFIAIDRSKGTLTAWIAKGSENVESALELKIN
nr:MAG TPA: metallophosphatase domain protein [Caudoviricetes sp.]